MKTKSLLSYSAVFALSVACSLTNAPAELYSDDDFVFGDGDLGDGDLGDGDVGDGDVGDGDGGGTGGSMGGDGDAPLVPPTEGLLVIAGTDDADRRILSVLDAENGMELAREELQAALVAYDNRPGRQLWYVFVLAGISPSLNEQAELQVRRYNDTDNTWDILGRETVPPPLLTGNLGVAPGTPSAQFTPVVLNDGLAYISQVVTPMGPSQAVTIVNTTDPASPGVIDSPPNPPTGDIVGLVGRRGTELDPGAKGGSITVMRRMCPAGDTTCTLQALPFTVTDSVRALSPDDDFGNIDATPAFTSTPVRPALNPMPGEPISLGAYAAKYDTTRGTRWLRFNPADPFMANSEQTIVDSSTRAFVGLAVDECRRILVASSDDGTEPGELEAVHLENGNSRSTPLAFASGLLEFEPFSGKLMMARSSGDAMGPSIRSYDVDLPTDTFFLSERTVGWSPPDDMTPISFAVRSPESPECP